MPGYATTPGRGDMPYSRGNPEAPSGMNAGVCLRFRLTRSALAGVEEQPECVGHTVLGLDVRHSSSAI
jgi:hypothetical protein